jgi:probable F420-dependent oxidoreductase
MRFAAQLPQSGPTATARGLIDGAVSAERAGIDTLVTTDRIMWPVAPVTGEDGKPTTPPEHQKQLYEHLETLAAVAAVTDHVRLLTGITVTIIQAPVLLARRLATIDQFAGGRLVIGVGQGWMQEEFDVAGVPRSRRGAGFEEHVAAMRAVWGPDPVSFDGRFYSIPPSYLSPKPVNGDKLPIYCGAQTKIGYERGARYADGWEPGTGLQNTTQALHDQLQFLIETAKAAGREPMPVHIRAHTRITESAIDGERAPLSGSPEQIAEDLPALADLGVEEICLNQTQIGVPFDEQVELILRVKALTS